MAYNFSPLPIWQQLDATGKPYAGGLLYTYEAGSTDPKDTYGEDDSANTNPVVLDAAGRATIKLGNGKYKFIFTDGVGATEFDPDEVEGSVVWEVDNIGDNISSITLIRRLTWIGEIDYDTINNDSAIILMGYAEIGDGGGGIFIWNKDSADAEDFGIVIEPHDVGMNAGRWIRQYSGGINPRWWGALGNGGTDDTDAFEKAIDYATANNLPIELDHGTFNLATDPGLLYTGPQVFMNNAILKWAGYRLSINPVISISDTNRHFIYETGDEPIFPATAEIKNIWLDGATIGWLQTSFALETDMVIAETNITNLQGSGSQGFIILDNAGTWISGTLVASINGTDYSQDFDTSKDISMAALAVKIAANAAVDSASYTATTHTLFIAPKDGKSIFTEIDYSGLTGGSTLTATVMTLDDYLLIRLIAKGADIASANNITLLDGHYFHITGTTQVNLINTVGWTNGKIVELYFESALTVKHNQTVSSTYYPIYLSNLSDLIVAAGDKLVLVLDGSVWRELYRTTAETIVASGSFNAIFPTSKTLAINYVKFASGVVRIWFNSLTGMVDEVTHEASGTPVPATIIPTANRRIKGLDVVGTVNKIYEMVFYSTGVVSIRAEDLTTTSTGVYSNVLHYFI